MLVLSIKFRKQGEVFVFILGLFGYGFGIWDESTRIMDSHPITMWYHGYYYALFQLAVLSHFVNYHFIFLFDFFALIYRLTVISWDTEISNIFFLIVADLVVLFGIFDREKRGRSVFNYLFRYIDISQRFENFVRDYWPSDLLIVNLKEDIIFAKCAMLNFGKEGVTKLTQSGLSLFTLEEDGVPSSEPANQTEEKKQKTFVGGIQSMLQKVDYNETQKCVASITVEDNDMLFDINMVWIKWGAEMSLAVIFNDISHRVTIKNLTESKESKDKVIASMSHEIRTPINGMKGVLKMIEKTTKNPVIIDYLNLCYKNCDFLLNIVNSMLDMQLLSAHKFKLNLSEVNLSHIFSQLKSLFEFHCSQTGLFFHCEVDPRLPTLMTDKNRLFQILVNLIGNAIKFTSKGGITLTGTIDPENPFKVQISVTDTGIGIKEEDKAHLFTMFGKLDDTKKQNVQGIGLGLVISNELVKTLNSEHSPIDLESEYGRGTRFFFRIPLTRGRVNNFSADEILTPGLRQDTRTVEQKINIYSMNLKSPFWKYKKDDNEEVKNMLSPTASSNLYLDQSKVMIVDDNPFNLAVHSYLVKDMGLDVVTALNGQEALHKIKEYAKGDCYFRMILMDLEMPIMDGFEAIKKIKEMISKHEIPYVLLVALSSHEGQEEKNRCIDLGVDEYLTKPLDEKALLPIFTLAQHAK